MIIKKYNTGIYQIVNLNNGKRYIGSAVNLKKRKNDHFNSLIRKKHYNNYLQRGYNKHGKEKFKFGILLYCSKKDLIFYEQRTIDSYDLEKELYNLSPTAGNNLGAKLPKLSEEHKRKISELNKGKKLSFETRKKMSDSWKNRSPMTNKTRKKISESKKGEKNYGYGKPGTMLGKKHSKKSLKKMSDIKKGKKQTRQTKEKISKANKKPIKVFLYKTGEFIENFDSLKECSKKLNITIQDISNTLKKRQRYAKGYTFEYIKKKDK